MRNNSAVDYEQCYVVMVGVGPLGISNAPCNGLSFTFCACPLRQKTHTDGTRYELPYLVQSSHGRSQWCTLPPQPLPQVRIASPLPAWQAAGFSHDDCRVVAPVVAESAACTHFFSKHVQKTCSFIF